MKSIIRNFSVPTEFCLILFICFGVTIVGNTAWLAQHLLWPAGADLGTQTRHLRNEDFIFILVLELVTMAIALRIGRIRGWSLATLGLRVSWKWTGVGVLLFLAFGMVGRVLRWMVTGLFENEVDFHRVSHGTLPVVMLISIVNPIFEETFECGYFFQALQRNGMWITVFASALFRGFLHTTMGINGFVFMFAEGLLHGFFYWRYGQLWPLIIAHTLQMLYALVPSALGWVTAVSSNQ